MLKNKFWLLIFSCLLCSCSSENSAATFQVKASIDLPENCFVQGFIKQADAFYLSCGRYKQSQLLKLSNTGQTLHQQKLADTIFAEGIAISNEEILLLSWKKQQALSFHVTQLKPLQRYFYNGEGWGLEHYNEHWLKSDGSAHLQQLDKHSLKLLQQFSVLDERGQALSQINELENLHNYIAANIWHSNDVILLKKPLQAENRVAMRLNLSPIANKHKQQGVLNGLAYDAVSDCLWVTGKLWGKAYALSIDMPELKLTCSL